MQKLQDFDDKVVTWEKMANLFKSEDKFRCFNNEIFDVRFDPVFDLVLWKDRERMGDTYYNISEDGRNPNMSELDPNSNK